MFFKNEKGIALVTSLMFTLISLGIIMMLLYMVTQATKINSANKKYKTAIEASYGAVDLVAMDILPAMIGFNTFDATKYSDIALALPDAACLAEKLKKPTSLWNSTLCNSTTQSLLPNIKSDFTFNLKSTNDNFGYNVYAKIVDTKCTAALPDCTNSKSSSIEINQTGLTLTQITKIVAYNNALKSLTSADPTSGGGGGGEILPKPAYYTIEVQGESATNAHEKSKLSVLYAY